MLRSYLPNNVAQNSSSQNNSWTQWTGIKRKKNYTASLDGDDLETRSMQLFHNDLFHNVLLQRLKTNL